MVRYALVAVPVPLKTEFTYSFDPDVMDIRAGMRVIVPFGFGKGKVPRKVQAYVIDVLDSVKDEGFEIKPIIRVIDKEPLFDKKDYDLALWMERFYFSSRGEILDTMIPGGKKDMSFGGLDADEAIPRPDVVLTDEQENAVRTVIDGKQMMYYIFGVTGSGKTEVFLRCAERVIEEGGQVIYLVPEITLTHQLALQVTKRFKNNVAILHSGLTDSQRIAQWRRIKRSEVKLVIGARSAVFAPFSNLKMIIIDEEHENSYKSGNAPRYHARQVAQKRIADCGGKLLMGSATPSLEAWHLMKDPSKMVRIDLKNRVGGGAMPKVEIADMTKESGIFSTLLQERMLRTLSLGKQVILFLNRRGYSYYFHCRSCGYELKCPRCDVALTYHKRRNMLQCHYCGYMQRPISKCPQCGSMDVMYSGFGTEQVEQELGRLFPLYKVARLDTDTVSKDRTTIQKTLDEFRSGEIQILLGTQMVAKGLNFPNVRLVGIVMADSGLLIPDFRAEERTFDLLVQVSGRSGRSDSEGEVIIQTRTKDNPAITFASKGDVQGFFDQELAIREETHFPPFSRMANIVFRSTNASAAKAFANQVANALRQSGKGVQVYGANECPIEKIRSSYRFQVLVRSKDPAKMLASLNKVIGSVKAPYNVYMDIDMDPVDLL
ncbi:MAG: primosomal protein N' [Spirochaetales bacterium]|nr:primosomal protein N' [Spirochaetales bacterium]